MAISNCLYFSLMTQINRGLLRAVVILNIAFVLQMCYNNKKSTYKLHVSA